MNTFTRRRVRNSLWFLTAALLVLITARLYAASLRSSSAPLGWMLFAVVILLSAFSARKNLPFLRLGSASSWTQLHIYAGLMSGILFLAHIRFRFPAGRLEVLLAALFLGVFVSGVFGLILTRVLPHQLTSRGEAILYDRIPAFREQLRHEAEALVHQAASVDPTSIVPEFHATRLVPFFKHVDHPWLHLVGLNRMRRTLLEELSALHRYTSLLEQDIMKQLAERIELKDHLDHQHVLQTTLRWWLFVHVPITYALLLTMLLHVLLVYAFSGSLR